ncbi:MAG: VCBS repeat-containing protein, partial [Saprospiraceae bacterium]|nr:VCBS repeat-containing protein [Saprospiraceae bacterium]
MKEIALLLVISGWSQTVWAQLNFYPESIDADIEIGYGLAIGDMDGDGHQDIILADKKAFVWYHNPDWKKHTIIEDLTERDNVCLAARDIDNDGRVEVAVGAQWNPGETVDESQSGSVHYLISPGKDEQSWRAIALPHEPTVHRMGWIKTEAGFQLVVVPLHGRGNQGGEGRGVCIYSYLPPKDPLAEWTRMLIDSTMHITHNFDIIEED